VTTLEDLLFRTIGFGVLTTFAAWKVNRIWVSASVLFWVSWLFLIVCAIIGVEVGSWEIPNRSVELVREAYWGAFLGGLLGILMAGRAKDKIADGPDWQRFIQMARVILDRFLLPYVALMFIVGSAHFVYRWMEVDFDLYRIGELRATVVAEQWPVIARLGNYVALPGTFLLVLLGAVDATPEGISTGKLLAAWLCSAPHGLAFGGRGWTIGPLLLYTFSFLLTRSCSRRPAPLRRLLRVGTMVVIGLGVFTVLGTIRHSTSAREEQLSPDSWDTNQRFMVAMWAGSSMVAVGVHGEFVSTLQPSWGAMTFDYFFRKANDMGFAATPPGDDWEQWRLRDVPFMEEGVAFTWCVPPTAIPYLIYDYGERGMPVALGLLLALLHWLSVRWVGQGVFRHIVAFLAFYATFNTIQTLVTFTALVVWVLFFALLAQTFMTRLARRNPKQGMMIAPEPNLVFAGIHDVAGGLTVSLEGGDAAPVSPDPTIAGRTA
jgi:hypothetical protein